MNDQNPGKQKAIIYAVIILLVLTVGIAILIAFSLMAVGWAWGLIIVFLGILLFLLVSSFTVAPKTLSILKQLFPVIDEQKQFYEGQLAEQKRFYENYSVVGKMEYVLGFYNLCPHLTSTDVYTTPRILLAP